jgi:NADPH-dependent 2,4-dienoyl-CoA reductase/sulfur reductase-like enzyme/nitrite reductase/ring-hydroxylating ferredoxin subunit
MGGTEQKLSGPDFKKGVAVDSVKPGQKLLGHAEGAPVLLIRENDKFYAIGAHCTHYNANLNDGVIVNGSIRCPWHHACFDIKTGEAVKAPALNPLPAWKTEIRNGMVYVGEKCSEDAHKPGQSSKEHFVIIGSGASGHAAAERLRHLGFLGALTILSEDRDLPYDRPNLSKDYLAGNAPEEWMSLRSEEFYKEQRIDLRLNVKVTELDPKHKRIGLAGGRSIDYDKCLIATGGRPVKPNIYGIDLPHVHFLRSFSDCKSLISALSGIKKVIIVGAGFIGLEAAAALKARGLDVTIVAPNEFPLEHVVGREIGSFLKSVHEKNGVRFHLRRFVEKIEKSGVILDDKSILSADLVLVATGIQPSADFAKDRGIRYDNGILVNEYLETDAQDVFATGDVARWPSQFSQKPIRIEHWVVAQRQGQVAAENMMGKKRKYKEVPFFWSQQFDVILNYVGYSASPESAKIYGNLSERDCVVAYSENGTITAALTIGRDLQSLQLERAFEERDQEAIRRILNSAAL